MPQLLQWSLRAAMRACWPLLHASCAALHLVLSRLPAPDGPSLSIAALPLQAAWVAPAAW